MIRNYTCTLMLAITGVGATLVQRGEKTDKGRCGERLLGYFSGKFKLPDLHYLVLQKEAVGVVEGTKHLRVFV